jgi:arachidonate 5-lipoxygenase
MDLMSKAYQRFKLDDLNVPKSFKRRGVLNEATLKGYHHRDDALLAWACLRRFADSIFRQHYARDADVVEDIYVQNMIGEMQRFGYQGAHEDQHGVPSSIDSIEQLVDICTSVMYTCSFTHAAVNFSQWDYYSYVPNRPLIMRKPAPKAKVQITEEDLISALPSVKQGAQTMATGWTLSRFSKEEVYVGHYLADMMVTHGEIAALQELRSDLNAMAQTIDKRNAKLGIKAYPYMHPARVPSNIGV